MRYRTRPIYVTAWQWKPGQPLNDYGIDEWGVAHTRQGCFVGKQCVTAGDWLVSAGAEVEVMSKEKFEEKYERAPRLEKDDAALDVAAVADVAEALEVKE